jgi:acetate kinase
MKILVCNAGSTSLKFKLYEMPACTVIAQCKIERVGSRDDALFQYVNHLKKVKIDLNRQNIPNYRAGIVRFLDCLTSEPNGVIQDIGEVERVGYKATVSKGHFGVHELTEEVLRGMQAWLPIATLHNTAYIETIHTMRSVLPEALFVGAFETAFHRDIPLERRMYGIPYEWYERFGIQRLGYHSASHGFMADLLNESEPGPYKAISCHLGGSSSICAIHNGQSIDTSFGMSLQSGLIHANRVGDMDCDLVYFLAHEGLSEAEIKEGLERNGGLQGLSGVSGDLRYVEKAAQEGNARAKLALNVFVSGIVRFIGAFFVELGGLDTLIFTGGIGENSATIRRMVCDRLGVIGVQLSPEKNAACQGMADLSTADSQVAILVIPTDEEIGIARRTYEFKR